jgi:Xaa-Pro dipeptidase
LPAALLVRETALQFASPMPMRSTPARAPKLPATRMYATARALLMRDSASSAGDLITLMQMPNDVTLTAMRHVQGNIQSGMQAADVSKLMGDATVNLGGSHEFSLVLLNEASAFPHGSKLAQTVREGSIILLDCGCTVQGYQSDISRTWIFGEPTPRQREVWNMVKRGQEIALETARIGTPVGTLDKAVRAFYESHGWSKHYALPGLSHRTGHGIGMDDHENPVLVRSDTTPLAAGMCFSDEPGLYIPESLVSGWKIAGT